METQSKRHKPIAFLFFNKKNQRRAARLPTCSTCNTAYEDTYAMNVITSQTYSQYFAYQNKSTESQMQTFKIPSSEKESAPLPSLNSLTVALHVYQ